MRRGTSLLTVCGFWVSLVRKYLSSEVMFGRKNALFGVCVALLQAVTTSGKTCKYKVMVRTGNEENAGTDDNIYIRIGDDAFWQSLDNPSVDDFERGNVDTFHIDSDCVSSAEAHKCRISITSSGYADYLYCFTNDWLVTNIQLKTLGLPRNESWVVEWSVYMWISCRKELRLVMLWEKND